MLFRSLSEDIKNLEKTIQQGEGELKARKQKKFGDAFHERLLSGSSVGTALKDTAKFNFLKNLKDIKKEFKRLTSKQTYDPVRMAKNVGGKGVGALVGTLMGRKPDDIKKIINEKKVGLFSKSKRSSRDITERTSTPDRKSTRLNSSHIPLSRMPSSA